MTAGELIVLGAGSILPRSGYGCSGYALRLDGEPGVTLLDCGPGSIRALGSAGIGLHEVRRVVISHFHPDHCLDLYALAFARRNPQMRDLAPIEYIGPVGLGRVLVEGPPALARWVLDPKAELFEIELREVERDSSASVSGGAPALGELQRGSLRLRCVRTGHTPEALAWRVDVEDRGAAGGLSLTYSGDSGEQPAVAELAAGSQVFLCECSFPDGQAVAGHLTPSSAARLAERAGVARLVLTHFYPSCDPEAARACAARTFRGTIELAQDGSVHRLGADT